MGKPDYQITELRFGNYLMFNGHSVAIVEELDGMEMTVNGLSALDDDIFDAIPLDEKWLKKFGFIDPYGKGTSLRIDISNSAELCWHIQEHELYLQTKIPGTRRLLPTKFVHQLQNLYYSLTGTELVEIKC